MAATPLPAPEVVASTAIDNLPVDIEEVEEIPAVEAQLATEVPPASEIAVSDGIVNLQSETPAAVEASVEVPPAASAFAVEETINNVPVDSDSLRAGGTSGSHFGCNCQSAIQNTGSCRSHTGFGD